MIYQYFMLTLHCHYQMRSTMRSRLFLLSIILLIGVSCQHKKATTEKETVAAGNTYTNPLLERGAEPWAIFHEGKYYYTQGSENRVILWETDDITDLSHATQKDVWIPTDPSNSYHLWAPEIHRINNNGIFTLPQTTAIWIITRFMLSRMKPPTPWKEHL